MKIKITILLSILVITLTNAMEVPQRQRGDADSIIGLIINCEFDKALYLSDSLSKVMPDEPLYPILNLMTYGLRNLDFDRAVDTASFMDSYRKSKEAMAKYKKNSGKTSYGLTLEGFIKASYASYRIYHGKYFSAIGEGLDAVKLLKEAVEIDSTNVDSYFFLGFYSYARGELKKKLWMLLFWYPGSRKEGKRMLEECSKTAQIASIPSQMILADIYREEKEYAKNDALIKKLLNKYPKSRFMMWAQARREEQLKNLEQAAEAYGWLADSYEKTEHGSYNALVTREQQLSILKSNDNKVEASELAKKVLKKNICDNSDKDYQDICKKIRRYIMEKR